MSESLLGLSYSRGCSGNSPRLTPDPDLREDTGFHGRAYIPLVVVGIPESSYLENETRPKGNWV